MSWTQVYVMGLSRSVDPSDEDIEAMLDERYSLSNDANLVWAGPGTTLIKRDDKGNCRGFAFLTFYSSDGATIVIDRINDGGLLQAELSDPKSAKEKKKNSGGGSGTRNNDLPDLRLKRQRGQPVRKHPVITSSNGKKTNLGSKTK